MFFNFDAKRQTVPENRGGGGFLSFMPVSGMKVDDQTAFTYSAFWACVKIISETVSYLPWHVMNSGSKKNVATDNPLDRIVYRSPNSEMSAFQFKELIISQALTWGNFHAEIERNRIGDIVNLWPIDASRVNRDRDNNGRLVYEISNEMAGNTVIQPKDIFHVRGPSRDGINGYSVIEMSRESIGLGLASEAFGAAFFGNGAIPATVIKNGGGAKLSGEGVKNLLSTWNKKNKGAKNARRTEYLDAGLEVEVLGIPPSDAQFLETRKFQITEIARWFRIPPHKLADLERSTHTNIESQNIEFVTDSILPWVSRIETQADFSLLRESDYGRYYNKINVKGLMRGDSKARSEYYKTLAALGALSIDEIRDLEDQDLLGGDVGGLRMVPMNMTTPERMVSGDIKQGSGVSNSVNGLMLETAQRFCKLELKRVAKAHEKTDYRIYLQDFYIGHARSLVDGFSRVASLVFEQLNTKPLHIDSALTQFFGDYVSKSADQLQNAIESERLNALLCSWDARKAENLARDLTNHLIKEAKSHV